MLAQYVQDDWIDCFVRESEAGRCRSLSDCCMRAGVALMRDDDFKLLKPHLHLSIAFELTPTRLSLIASHSCSASTL